MDEPQLRAPTFLPATGCVGMTLALFLLVLLPFVLIDAMQAALLRLQLSPAMAFAAVLGIFLGSFINVPVHRIAREEEQVIDLIAVLGPWSRRLAPRPRRVQRHTIVAVNVGGCLIPVILSGWETANVVAAGGWPLVALAMVVAANVALCYRVARPVESVGIAIPVLLSPVFVVMVTIVLLRGAEYAALRPPVAFIGGVLGPLVGADLLHLRDVSRIATGMASIGGAGTFDGIVLSGILAALLV